MAEKSLEEIVGEVRQLTGSLASARLVGADGDSAGSDPEQMRIRAARLIDEALGGHLQQALSRIEADHRKNLSDLWRDQATVLGRLCDELEQAVKSRPQDERALEERVAEVAVASVERKLLPEIENLNLVLHQQQADLLQLIDRPRLLTSSATIWLVGVAFAFIGGALFAPELGQVLEAAVGAFG
ncbi:hypothetical protein [Rhodospirillaceae bacterium SYSU D60014]|uniref:hypothetical protein n=1 Tax=Virgifigura deserti TaxID=2268457 RepID=UPI000E65EF29